MWIILSASKCVVYVILIQPTQKMSQNVYNFVSVSVCNPLPQSPPVLRPISKCVEFQDETFDMHENFARDCPTGQIGGQKLKSRFYSGIFQKIRKISTFF